MAVLSLNHDERIGFVLAGVDREDYHRTGVPDHIAPRNHSSRFRRT